uniref:LIM and senescent cell antigen-like-containing domain protein 2 n=1 Tax=Molossus molossus TaxID=27622 RepID=A0A7J8FSL4_MOLMO|nr:LIM zinc finger domain containing 2 [Molossus molossus]
MLFAPCCGSCGEFIVGRVIKAVNRSWHPGCFLCELCGVQLADLGFVRNAGRHLCRPCHNREKAKSLGKYLCQRCHQVIEEKPLMFRSDAYHPDHFSCTFCRKELTAEARELKGELCCLPCHDKVGVPICGACRRPIEGRVVNALGKQWHVEHFVCAKCEKPFLGHRHYEKKGLAYCETHYSQGVILMGQGCPHPDLRLYPGRGARRPRWMRRALGVAGAEPQPAPGPWSGHQCLCLTSAPPQLFGDVCYSCSHVIEGDVVSALNKAWCVHCFCCSACNGKLALKSKFVEFDMKPVCKRCYHNFPLELKRRLRALAGSARSQGPRSGGLRLT